MNQLFANLDVREKFLLMLAAVLVAVALLYGLVWNPLGDRVESLRETVAEQTGLYRWMEQSAREVQQLRGRQPAVARGGRQSLLSLTDRTARERGLGSAIRRVEPEGTDKVRIQLEQAPFDEMVGWLEDLVGRHGVRIEIITIDDRDQAGVVNARLTLQSPTT